MTQSKEINTYMNRLGSEAKEASLILAQASLEQKNEALSCISEQIESDRDEILSTNKKDLDSAKQKSIGSALIDRLEPVSYTHLRAHDTKANRVRRDGPEK